MQSQEHDHLRRSNRSKASAALFYAQLEELTKNVKQKTCSQQSSLSLQQQQSQSQNKQYFLPYQNLDQTYSYVQFIFNHNKDQIINPKQIRRIQKKKQYDDEIYDLEMFKMDKSKSIKKHKQIKQKTKKLQRINLAPNNNKNNLLQMLISCAEQVDQSQKNTIHNDKQISALSQSQINQNKLNYIKRTYIKNNSIELELSSNNIIQFQNQNLIQNKKFDYTDSDLRFLLNLDQDAKLKEMKKILEKESLNISIYGNGR